MPARRKSRPAVDVWTPQLRLYEDDAKMFQCEPFATVFAEYSAKVGTTPRKGRSGHYLWDQLHETMRQPRYVQHTSDFLCFTLGAKIVDNMPEEAIIESGKLLLDVWYIRYLHQGSSVGEDLAYEMLFEAQTQNLKTYCDSPDAQTDSKIYYESYGDVSTDFCWNDDLDRRETWQEDLDGERDSDWEDWDSDDSKDGDYQDEEEEEAPMDVDDPVCEDLDGHEDLDDLDDLDHPELPQFVEDATHGNLRPLPDKPSKPLDAQVDSAPLELWAAHIKAFFFPDNVDGPREVGDVREDLVQMRRLPSSIYQSESFQQTLQKSSFLGYLYDVCEPGTMLETSHPDVEESYRWHNWSVSYAELICRWIEPTLADEDYLQSLPKCDENYRFSQDLAMDLLKFMSDHPRMLPWGFDPMAVFMFISLDSFTVNCEKWLVPCLRTLKYPWIDGWNAATVYREIMNLPVFKNPDEHANVLEQLDHRLAVVIEETSKHHTVLAKVKDELLRPAHRPDAGEVTDMEDTSEEEDEDEDEADEDSSDDEMDVDAVDGVQPEPVASTSSRPPPPPRKLLTELSKEGKKRRQREEKKRRAKDGRLPRHSGSAGLRAKEEVLAQPAKKKRAEEGPGPCPYCALLPRKQHCVRIVPVRRRKCKHLIGAALTCASLKNRLKPLPPARRKGHAPKPRPRIRFYHPFKQLNMKLIKFRPEVYKRCKKDIVRFVWRAPDGKEEMVGGVRFKPFSKPILGRLNDNHRLVQVRAIRRRDMMQRWAYGSITGRGSRQPSGGRKGDCYGPYACHRGDTPDDIRALFRDAVSTDAMVEVGDTIAPGMRKNINELTRKSGVERLGRTGLTNYVCSNYINCLHPDNDGSLEDFLAGRGKKDSKGGLYPCAQLLKKGCGKHAFNFAYARFGVVIRTMTNTVWVFNGRHVHGTVMPSQSRMMRLRGGAGKGDGSKGSHPNAKAANVARARKIREIRGGYNLRPRPA